MFQPLGLKIAETTTVYVLGRDQITRLHDLNNDGEADFYENFNNDIIITSKLSRVRARSAHGCGRQFLLSPKARRGNRR